MPRRRWAALPSRYRIFETSEYLRKLKKLTAGDREFVSKKASSYIYPQIGDEPHFGQNARKLKGYEPAMWRYRLGNFRLFYAIDEDTHVVSILTVDDRRDAYR